MIYLLIISVKFENMDVYPKNLKILDFYQTITEQKFGNSTSSTEQDKLFLE